MSGFRPLGEETVYEGPVFRLTRGRFAAPDGEEFTRDLIRMRPAVAVVPVDGDEVVLVRQYRAPLDRLVLEIPAGLCDVDGEAPEATARRELREEAGLEAGSVERLCSFFQLIGSADHEVVVYLATGLRSVPPAREGPEERHLTVERHRLADADRLVADGTVVDAKTVIALLLARDRLRP